MNADIVDYMTDEYIFHGSVHASLKRLIPNKPHDAGDDPRNKEIAVYATDDISEAIIFSLISGFCGTFMVTRSEGNVVTSCFPKSFSDQLKANTGSLYVLKMSDFVVREQWQYKSYVPVTPVAEIKVTLRDYLDFGGRLEFREEGPPNQQ